MIVLFRSFHGFRFVGSFILKIHSLEFFFFFFKLSLLKLKRVWLRSTSQNVNQGNWDFLVYHPCLARPVILAFDSHENLIGFSVSEQTLIPLPSLGSMTKTRCSLPICLSLLLSSSSSSSSSSKQINRHLREWSFSFLVKNDVILILWSWIYGVSFNISKVQTFLFLIMLWF